MLPDNEKEAVISEFAQFVRTHVRFDEQDLLEYKSCCAYPYVREELSPNDKWGAPDITLGYFFWLDDFSHLPDKVRTYLLPAMLRYVWCNDEEFKCFGIEEVTDLVWQAVELGWLHRGVTPIVERVQNGEPRRGRDG